MSYPNLGPAPKAHDPQAVKRWLQKLNRRLGNNATPIFNSLTLTSLTADRLVASDADKKLVSTDLFDWIDGTSNQVTVSDDGDGTVTLGTPQDIHTGASPTFSGLTLSGFTPAGFVKNDASGVLSGGNSISLSDITDWSNFLDSWAQNGFDDRTQVDISWSDSSPDRTFTISPVSGSYTYRQAGVEYTKSSPESIQIDDTEGLWAIYYDGDTLSKLHNPNSSDIDNLIVNKVLVAYVYWDATNSKGALMSETHEAQMSPQTHLYLHNTIGLRYNDGLAVGDIIADGDGSLDAHAQFSITAGSAYDEDIKHTYNAKSSTDDYELWYRKSTNTWTWETISGGFIKTGGSGLPVWDDDGTLTEMSSGNFVLYHVFATNLEHGDPIVMMGQSEYSNLNQARVGAAIEIDNLIGIGTNSKELKPIATIIVQGKNTYSNSWKARIVSVDGDEDYIDWRTAPMAIGAAAADHGTLAGLSDDDHPQYALRDDDVQFSDVTVTGLGPNEIVMTDANKQLTSTNVIDLGSSV